ncbi:MAG: fumarylacetoacetate hydrolase family protein [Fidelibacterota bacterium]
MAEMIFSIPKQISYLSKMTALMKGDLIYTDTPREAGLIQSGDTLIPGIDGKTIPTLRVK